MKRKNASKRFYEKNKEKLKVESQKRMKKLR